VRARHNEEMTGNRMTASRGFTLVVRLMLRNSLMYKDLSR